jgi:hypothetical protein
VNRQKLLQHSGTTSAGVAARELLRLSLGPCRICCRLTGRARPRPLLSGTRLRRDSLGAPEMTQWPASYGTRSRLNFCRICDVPPAPSTRRRRGPQQPAERQGGRSGPA